MAATWFETARWRAPPHHGDLCADWVIWSVCSDFLGLLCQSAWMLVVFVPLLQRKRPFPVFWTDSGRGEGVSSSQVVGKAGQCEGNGVARLVEVRQAPKAIAALQGPEYLLDRPAASGKDMVSCPLLV